MCSASSGLRAARIASFLRLRRSSNMRSSRRPTSLARSVSAKKTAAYARSTMSSDESLMFARSPLTVLRPSPASICVLSGYSEDRQRNYETDDSQEVHAGRDEGDRVVVRVETEPEGRDGGVVADRRRNERG